MFYRGGRVKSKAVFIDRDGTINEEVGHLREVSRFEFYPDSARAIRILNKAAYKVVVVTNQAGVARGYFNEERVEEIHSHMRFELAKEEAWIDAIYYCVHHPEFGDENYGRACSCRKPEPGMIFQAASDLDIDLSYSYMIGDTVKDMIAGKRAGCKTILVTTGHGAEEVSCIPSEFAPNFVAKDLFVAVNWLILQDQI
ncbi:MAG: D-glycero-beta-D-manno-heptose 1,7-bisphosphate 7-phosphatase [Actinobacteria bacterium]|nr:D-glycero-beta-D-manno-heptose 1,7-bisphosphate 7-phosphatase [Actinomycetota bacterium]